MAARQVGAEPSSPSVQLEHLADLQRNLGNSQQNPSLYEVWRPKIVEDIEKQTVKRLHWDGKVPGICAGNQATEAPGPIPAAGYREEPQNISSLLYQSREGSRRQEGPGDQKYLGGIETKWETHGGGIHLLGLWMPAPEKLRCLGTSGEGRSWAVSDPDLDSLQTGQKVGLCEKLYTC